jgi:two-component system, OmpR family, response regulator Irr
MVSMTQASDSILLVEDDLSLRDSLCQFLKDHGYRTLEASTAKQGWELVQSGRPRLLLLDLNLPDGSGLDLLKKLSQRGGTESVVVMTAFDLKHVRPAEANRVLAGWMTKPVNPVELLRIVEKVMGSPEEKIEDGE